MKMKDFTEITNEIEKYAKQDEESRPVIFLSAKEGENGVQENGIIMGDGKQIIGLLLSQMIENEDFKNLILDIGKNYDNIIKGFEEYKKQDQCTNKF